MVHFAYEAEELAARREVHQKVQVLLCLHTQVQQDRGRRGCIWESGQRLLNGRHGGRTGAHAGPRAWTG
jgi:hypothetical protein